MFFLYITSNNFHLLNVHANFFSNLYIFTSTSIIFLYHWYLHLYYIHIDFLLNIYSFITNMHIFQKFHSQQKSFHNFNATWCVAHRPWQMATIVLSVSMPKNVKIMYLHLHIHHNSLPLVFTYPLCTHWLLLKHILFHSQYMHIFQTYFSMPWCIYHRPW